MPKRSHSERHTDSSSSSSSVTLQQILDDPDCNPAFQESYVCDCVGDMRCKDCCLQKPKPRVVTPFSRRVYALTKRIPRGNVSTYGRLSTALHGDARKSRAVGNALRHNPFAPLVPCHRVIKGDLTIGGFSGSVENTSRDVGRKIRILSKEGIKFVTKGNKIVLADPRQLHVWTPDQLHFTESDLTDEALLSQSKSDSAEDGKPPGKAPRAVHEKEEEGYEESVGERSQSSTSSEEDGVKNLAGLEER